MVSELAFYPDAQGDCRGPDAVVAAGPRQVHHLVQQVPALFQPAAHGERASLAQGQLTACGEIFGSVRQQPQYDLEPVGAGRRGARGGLLGGGDQYISRLRLPTAHRLFDVVCLLHDGRAGPGERRRRPAVQLLASPRVDTFMDQRPDQRVTQRQLPPAGPRPQKVARHQHAQCLDGLRSAGAGGRAEHRGRGVVPEDGCGLHDLTFRRAQWREFVEQQRPQPGGRTVRFAEHSGCRRGGHRYRAGVAVGLQEREEVQRVAVARLVQFGRQRRRKVTGQRLDTVAFGERPQGDPQYGPRVGATGECGGKDRRALLVAP